MAPVALVMSVALSAYGGAAMLSNMSGTVASTMLAAGAMGGMQALSAIRQNRADVRAMLQSDSYKFIPVDPAPLEFRVEGLN